MCGLKEGGAAQGEHIWLYHWQGPGSSQRLIWRNVLLTGIDLLVAAQRRRLARPVLSLQHGCLRLQREARLVFEVADFRDRLCRADIALWRSTLTPQHVRNGRKCVAVQTCRADSYCGSGTVAVIQGRSLAKVDTGSSWL